MTNLAQAIDDGATVVILSHAHQKWLMAFREDMMSKPTYHVTTSGFEQAMREQAHIEGIPVPKRPRLSFSSARAALEALEVLLEAEEKGD